MTPRVRQIDSLGAFKDAADHAIAADLGIAFFGADKAEEAVFDQEAVADLDVIDQVGVDAADAAVFADAVRALDNEFIADGDGHTVAGDRPEPNLGAAEIAENRDGLAPPGGGFADVAEHLEMPIEIAMREI